MAGGQGDIFAEHGKGGKFLKKTGEKIQHVTLKRRNRQKKKGKRRGKGGKEVKRGKQKKPPGKGRIPTLERRNTYCFGKKENKSTPNFNQ